jgi:ATP-dependent RNA helicase DDX6/DHH1
MQYENRDRQYNNRRYNRRSYNDRNNYHRRQDYRDPARSHQQVQPKPPMPDLSGEDWKDKLKTPKKDTREQTEDVTSTKGTDFESFMLSRKLLAGVFEMGFEKPSPVQEECIPLIMMGKSVLARAKNGTGKTGAFAVPTLEKCDASNKDTQVLVLLPTRELALQSKI